MNKIYNVYNECEKMYLETDFNHRFPKIFLNFKKLKELKISGSRLFDIDCYQIPESVEILDIESRNMNEDVLNGIEKLVNLKKISVDFSKIFKSSIVFPNFPNLLNLREIYLNLFSTEENEYGDLDEYQKHKLFDKILDCDIFYKIKHRINKIYLELDTKYHCWYIVIKLSQQDKLYELNKLLESKPKSNKLRPREYGEKCECTGYPYLCRKHTTD